MKKCFLFILTLAVALSLFPLSAGANDSMIVGGTGGTVYAISNSDVEMEEEIIDILVKDGKTYVTCRFFFHNTGEKTTLMMGFPTEYYDYADEETEGDDEYIDDEDFDGPEDEYITALNGFRTYVRGKRVPVKVKSGLKPEGNNIDELYFPQWYTWKVTFDKGERVKVVNKYWAVNSGGSAHDWEDINYILRSGSTWKGAIGKVTVRMRMRGYDPSGVSFEEWQPSYIEKDGTVVWKAENLKPQQDIKVYYDDDHNFWYGIQNPFDTQDSDDAMYQAYERMGERMLRNFKARKYNGTTWWGNKFLRKFGDMQSEQFYYLMGVSYYKLGRYEKALGMLEKVKDPEASFYDSSYYYKARAYSKIGDKAAYISCVEYLNKSKYEWLKLWAQSRLNDITLNGTRVVDSSYLPKEFPEKYKINNEDSAETLITREYSLHELTDYFGMDAHSEGGYHTFLQNTQNIDNVDKKFKIECTRHDDGWHYTVYKVKEGGRYFVGWGRSSLGSFIVFDTIYINKIMNIKDFSSLQPGKSTYGDVIDIDLSTELDLKRSCGIFSYNLLNDGSILEIAYTKTGNECYEDNLIIESIEVEEPDYRPGLLGGIFKQDLVF